MPFELCQEEDSRNDANLEKLRKESEVLYVSIPYIPFVRKNVDLILTGLRSDNVVLAPDVLYSNRFNFFSSTIHQMCSMPRLTCSWPM